MSWSPELFGGCEAAKIAPHVVRYLQGRALDIGSGPGKVWPPVIGIDPATEGGRPVTDMAMDGTDLSMFADGSHDAVFSSFLLDKLGRDIFPVLKEWWRVLRVDGFLVLYLPHRDHFPPAGDPNGDPLHRMDMSPEDTIEVMKRVGSWTLLENEVRTQEDEYSFFQVFRRDE